MKLWSLCYDVKLGIVTFILREQTDKWQIEGHLVNKPKACIKEIELFRKKQSGIELMFVDRLELSGCLTHYSKLFTKNASYLIIKMWKMHV